MSTPNPTWPKVNSAQTRIFGLPTGADFVIPSFSLAIALMLLFSPHYPWYVAWLVPFFTIVPDLTAFAYICGLFYMCTTSLAVGFGPRQFLLNKILYGGVVLAGYHSAPMAGSSAALRAPSGEHAFMNHKNISVIIPALNEQESIAYVVGSMPWSDITECIVVDNGSTEGTAALAASAGARVVVSSRGYGAACKAGSDAAVDASTILVFMDGDPRECPIDHQLHQFGAEKIGQAEPEKVERTGSSRSSCRQSGSNR